MGRRWETLRSLMAMMMMTRRSPWNRNDELDVEEKTRSFEVARTRLEKQVQQPREAHPFRVPFQLIGIDVSMMWMF